MTYNLPLRTKRGKENCINGNREQGNLGQVGPEYEQPPPLAGRQGKEGIRKSPIEFVPVLEKAKGIQQKKTRI
jgi:hypothetical protein